MKFLVLIVEEPESMQRKEIWVARLYNAFCRKGKVADPFALSVQLICGILHVLGVACGYALNELEQVVVSSDRHLEMNNWGKEESRDTRLAL